jgi:hypothetical protein
MVEIYAEEFGSTGRFSIGVFQMLSAGKTGHPSRVGPVWAEDGPRAKLTERARKTKREQKNFDLKMGSRMG